MTFGIHRDGRTMLICPALARSQAERAGVQNIRSWKDGEDPVALFKQLAEEWGVKAGIMAVDDETPATMLLAMQEALPAALYRPGGSLLANLTREKDAEELAAMKKAADIADAAFPKVLDRIRPGVTEAEVVEALFTEMRKLGGIPTFGVCATGANGAEPHHNSDDTQIQLGDVVVLDFGCSVDGYNSDITRTVCCGNASEEAKEIYRIVYKAHMSARERIKPGVSAGSVDDGARSVITEAGYGEYFFHRTGHGIGLRIHEEPFIISGSEHALVPGECFSIEPGIYQQGKFGVRIENIVTVTENGYESFNVDPAPELFEVIF